MVSIFRRDCLGDDRSLRPRCCWLALRNSCLPTVPRRVHFDVGFGGYLWRIPANRLWGIRPYEAPRNWTGACWRSHFRTPRLGRGASGTSSRWRGSDSFRHSISAGLHCDQRPATEGSRNLTMRCSGRLLSSRRLQELQAALTGLAQQAARRLRAAADRER